MNNITVIGIDLAKNVFQVYAEDKEENKIYNRRMKRAQFIKWIEKLSPCVVGMEACGTAHYWGRVFSEKGHRVKLMNPKKVKVFVDRNKNDAKDAEAIAEATRSKKVLSIPIKTLAQQVLTSIHRARSQVVRQRTEVANHLRSQLAEYGVITTTGHAALEHLAQRVLGGEVLEADEGLLFMVSDLYETLKNLKKRLSDYDAKIKRIAKENKSACKLMTMPGIGEITATALVAKVEDFSSFKRGCNFAAWLGLTPKEYSSAGKRKLGGISKQGDRYLRTLLIHGARAVIQAVLKKKRDETSYHRWIVGLVERRGKNNAAVALANKHARMIWAIMKHGRCVDLDFAASFQESSLQEAT